MKARNKAPGQHQEELAAIPCLRLARLLGPDVLLRSELLAPEHGADAGGHALEGHLSDDLGPGHVEGDHRKKGEHGGRGDHADAEGGEGIHHILLPTEGLLEAREVGQADKDGEVDAHEQEQPAPPHRKAQPPHLHGHQQRHCEDDRAAEGTAQPDGIVPVRLRKSVLACHPVNLPQPRCAKSLAVMGNPARKARFLKETGCLLSKVNPIFQLYCIPDAESAVDDPLTMIADPDRTSRGWFSAHFAWGGVPTGNPMSTKANPDHEAARPRLEPDARKRIGAHLQAIFAEIEGQPLTDEQIDLLLALRRVERERGRKEF